jgi:hypothetical protein
LLSGLIEEEELAEGSTSAIDGKDNEENGESGEDGNGSNGAGYSLD